MFIYKNIHIYTYTYVCLSLSLSVFLSPPQPFLFLSLSLSPGTLPLYFFYQAHYLSVPVFLIFFFFSLFLGFSSFSTSSFLLLFCDRKLTWSFGLQLPV